MLDLDTENNISNPKKTRDYIQFSKLVLKKNDSTPHTHAQHTFNLSSDQQRKNHPHKTKERKHINERTKKERTQDIAQREKKTQNSKEVNLLTFIKFQRLNLRSIPRRLSNSPVSVFVQPGDLPSLCSFHYSGEEHLSKI